MKLSRVEAGRTAVRVYLPLHGQMKTHLIVNLPG